MLPQETIRRKRDGAALDAGEIEAFIAGLTSGAVTEGQAAAFAMAVFFNGMNLDERVALTRAMMRSGAVIDWSSAGLSGPVPRQAFDRRCRRQCQPDARADAGGLRRLHPDDFRPRPRPYRRHARQARFDPRLCRAARSRAVPPRGGRGRLRDHRPDRRSRPRRQAPLCDPRRHGDGGIDRADHRLDPVEETRGRPAGAGDGRENRLGRLHDQLRGRARPRARASRRSPPAPACRRSR